MRDTKTHIQGLIDTDTHVQGLENTNMWQWPWDTNIYINDLGTNKHIQGLGYRNKRTQGYEIRTYICKA